MARVMTPIRVTTIMPGAVTTELTSHLTDAEVREALRAHPPMRFMQAADVAAAVMFALTQPPHVDINQILLRPTEQAT